MVNEEVIRKHIAMAAEVVRQEKPLVGSITNAVSMNFVANAQLAVGGSAAMVYLAEEGVFLAQAAEALYVNMGTLLPVHEEALPAAVCAVCDAEKPWVLDPVGIGIGSLRERLLVQFKALKPNVIRGNASEIIALAGLWELEGGSVECRVHGVDTTDEVEAAESASVALARWTGGAVAVSGKVDLVTNGEVVAFSSGGSTFMEKVTGAGCSLGGVCAVYAAVVDPFTAALAATSIYNVAGFCAHQYTDAPASFQVAFLDELYKATATVIANNPLTIKEA